ncbi:MAG TPA: Clp protease N-terminal domain-containing protein [Puia sp.]|jgi:ATP-dependent Clp protease ATP-binding subunit ClpC|nr:Clp protease N-terminal domain-containing protein [Puia sp.]
MHNRFSTEVKETISFSAEEAHRMGSPVVSAGHLLLGLVRQRHNRAVTLLTDDLHIPLSALVVAIEETLPPGVEGGKAGSWRLPLDRGAERAIRASVAEAKRSGSRTVDAEHLLSSLFNDRDTHLFAILGRWGIQRLPPGAGGQ